MTHDNAYQIWIEASGTKLLLPVNPPKIDIKINGNNQSVTVAEMGETCILQSPKAVALSFSSFFPVNFTFGSFLGQKSTTANTGDYNGDGVVNVRDLAAKAREQGSGVVNVSENTMSVMPHYYINFLNSVMKEKIPVRVYITKCDFIRYMSIESFSYSQKGGDVGSYDYSISFKEYKEIKVRQVTVKNGKAVLPKASKTSRVNTFTKPKTYTTKKGDNLRGISFKFYRDIKSYKKIYEANKKLIGANPNKVKAGITLSLP